MTSSIVVVVPLAAAFSAQTTAPEPPAEQPSQTAAAPHQIIRSFVPGRLTILRYPAVLKCPDTIIMYTPERSVRLAVSGVTKVDCTVGPLGRLSACKDLAVEPQGHNFEIAAPRMAQRCDLQAPIPEGQTVRLQFVFETRIAR